MQLTKLTTNSHTQISGTVFESHMKCSTILVTHSINKHIMHAEIV